jgi:rubrerythrin
VKKTEDIASAPEDLKKLWVERMNLSSVCEVCGFPVKVKGRDGLTEKTEDEMCPICGSTKARNRYEKGVGDFKISESEEKK